MILLPLAWELNTFKQKQVTLRGDKDKTSEGNKMCILNSQLEAMQSTGKCEEQG